MSISGMVNTALSGIFTSQSAMKTTSTNIANINTAGYQRQVVRQENMVVGGESSGVRIASVDRIVDRFLQIASYAAKADAKSAEIMGSFHERFQGVLGRPESGSTISARLDQIFNSFSELTLNPSDRIVRQSMLSNISDFNYETDRIASSIQDLRNDASQRISEEVNNINRALARIHELNPLIVRQKALGLETAGLLTQRDSAIAEVSGSLDIRVINNADGSANVQSVSGTMLVDLSLRELEYLAPGVVSADTRFTQIRVHRLDPNTGQRVGAVQDLDRDIKSGTLRGLLNLRDGDLRDLSLSLGQLSATFIEQVNAVHNQFSKFPPENTLTGHATAVANTHATGFTGQATFAVTDSTGQVVAETLVDFTGAPPADYNALIAQVNAGLGGAGTLSLSNGVMSFTATAAANGVVIKDSATSPSRRGGMGFSHYFGMNDLVTANIEGNYKTGFTGTETHNLAAGGQTTFEVRDANGVILRSYAMPVTGTTINDQIADLNAAAGLGTYVNFTLDSNGQLNMTEQSGYANLTLHVVSDSTNFNSSGKTFSSVFGLGDRYQADAARGVDIRSDIKNDPSLLAMSSYDLSAGVGNIALSSGDQAGALALVDMQTGSYGFRQAGQLANLSTTFAQYSGAFLANAGLMAVDAENREQDNAALLVEINQRVSDVSGVNLDEELANMIVLQNSFNAAARILSTADDLINSILDIV